MKKDNGKLVQVTLGTDNGHFRVSKAFAAQYAAAEGQKLGELAFNSFHEGIHVGFKDLSPWEQAAWRRAGLAVAMYAIKQSEE